MYNITFFKLRSNFSFNVTKKLFLKPIMIFTGKNNVGKSILLKKLSYKKVNLLKANFPIKDDNFQKYVALPRGSFTPFAPHDNFFDILNDTSEWLYKNTGFHLIAKNHHDGLKFILKDSNEKQIDVANAGSGINSILSIIFDVFYAIYHEPYRTFIFIEYPETGLSVDLQIKLIDLFEGAIKYSNIYFFIETQSEYIIRKLQTLIADKTHFLTSDSVSIYYVNKDKNNISYVQEIELLSDGQFKEEWPDDLFNVNFNLAMDLIK